MTRNAGSEGNPLDYLVDTFWASLPERTADDLAKCKKDALNWVRNTVNWLVDEEIRWTERHLENARHMRESYRSTDSSPTGDSSNPA